MPVSAHVEKKWPFQVAQQLPKLSHEEIQQHLFELGLGASDHSSASDNDKVEIGGGSSGPEEARTSK